MKIRIKGIFSTLLVLIILFSVNSQLVAQDVEGNMMKFGRFLRLVDSYYVDTTNVEKLTENAIVEVLQKLDPHSVYISKDEVAKMNEPLQGNFEGIGISFNIFHDTLMVVTTIPGAPSEKVGLLAGDRIVKIDSENVAGIGLKNSDVFDMLRGKKGTQVKIKVLRKKENGLLDFTIIRDKIPINSLDASYMLDDHTGYIKLNKFSATTNDEFVEAVKKLKEEHRLDNLILDLRGNGGGYLNAAIDLADHFLGDYKMVVYTDGTHVGRKEYHATATGEFEKGKLAILINEGTASASEIVSGAVQDWDRGVVIGRRSFGKGLVQQPFYLTDGSMVRLTTAHYYTPSGRCIQKPYEDGVDEYYKDYMKRVERGELFSEDSMYMDSGQRFQTKVNKRQVYGGGGVIPDIFVPMDTSSYYKYYNKLVRKNVIYSGALEIMDNNRDDFEARFSDFDDFRKKFDVTDQMIEKVVANGEKEGVEKDDESMVFALPLMKKQIKALIARDLFSLNCYFQVMNEEDEEIAKALEVFDRKGEYEKILAEKL